MGLVKQFRIISHKKPNLIISFEFENHIIKHVPIIAGKVCKEGCGKYNLKKTIVRMIKNNPIVGNIELRILFLLLCPRLISKYANIEPANNSHILV